MTKTTHPDARPPIYLLDSMAFIFRAYHAMQRQRPMSTRNGVPTAATYVFVNMINKLRKDFQPQYLAAVYDLSGPVFRDERAREMKAVKRFNVKTQQFEEVEYAGYKANREEMPADLVQQLPYIRRALEAFRIPIVACEGYEADDVIGTLAARLAEQGHQVFVVSSDKDMMQLVNRNVSILNPTKDNLVLDPAKVEETLGVPPERVIDVMALRGDAVDNIPGAPGIGDKGSVELIQQFGTVEAALDAAQTTPDLVKRKTYRESLQNNRENILLSKELVTIHTTVPVECSLEAMQTQPPDLAACRDLFTELEFTTLLRELAPAPQHVPTAYLLEPTPDEVAALLQQARAVGLLAIAVQAVSSAATELTEAEAETEAEPPPPETMSLFSGPPPTPAAASAAPVTPAESVLLGLAASGSVAMRVRLDAPGVREALTDATLPKAVHDWKAVQHVLQRCGVTLAGVRDDVMLYSYLVNPTHGSHTLGDVAARFSERALAPVLKGEVREAMLLEAADAVARLAEPLRTAVAEAALTGVYNTMDLPLVPVLERMEEVGVRIDVAVLSAMSGRLALAIEDLAEKIYTQSGHRFNINSPKQLGDVLFNRMELPRPTKHGKGKVVSTAQDVLEELAEQHTVPALVLEFRQLSKLKGTYLDALPQLADANGRIHTTFNQVGTATGRLSSTNPNLQNIPVRTAVGREIRAAFVPAPGNLLLSADYSQIELRLMAHFSQDPLLLEAYRTGKDIHTLTASEVFGVTPESMDKETRNRAKAVNFGIVYGISPFGLAAQLGIPQAEARAYIDRYFERYQGVKAFIESTLEAVRREGVVRTHFGRIRPIPDIQSRNPNMRGFAERTAINTPLQGTAADLIKLAMIRIDAEIGRQGLRSRMTLQVHDELLFDVVPEEAEVLPAMVKQQMEHVAEFSVPIIAETGLGQNWRDIK
ncbi:MAG: DNA polymerase I [Acidobacteriota bacterium]|nr:DNA polymerase I [Acidobacteriota bacterium]